MALVSHPSRLIYYTAVAVVLFFLPIAVMTIAYSFIIWRLWSKRCPGERIESGTQAQNKVRRKVSERVQSGTQAQNKVRRKV